MRIGFENGLARTSTAVVAVAGAALGMPSALAEAGISKRAVRPAALVQHIGSVTVPTEMKFHAKRKKPETTTHRMAALTTDLGNKIVRLSRTSDVTTYYFHGKKNDPIGYAVSVAKTLVEPDGTRISYDFGVAYGKTHGKVDEEKILELDFSADATRVIDGGVRYTGPNEDFVFTHDPNDPEWGVVASYNRRDAKQTVNTFRAQH